jgi:hypothetical protein
MWGSGDVQRSLGELSSGNSRSKRLSKGQLEPWRDDDDYLVSGNDLFDHWPIMDGWCRPYLRVAATFMIRRQQMKMLITRMVLMTAMAVAPLVTAGAAYAQRHEGPGYSARQYYRGGDYRSQDNQRVIDEITHNDESAGK